jgi:hypothetical protein
MNNQYKYRAIIRPVGHPENWIVDCIEGNDMPTYIKNLYAYMLDLDIVNFEIIYISSVKLEMFAYEDIFLN